MPKRRTHGALRDGYGVASFFHIFFLSLPLLPLEWDNRSGLHGLLATTLGCQKKKLSVAKYSSSRCRRPLAAKSKSTDWPQCYWITRRLSIEGCHVYDEEPLRFLPFNKKALYGQMIDKAYDDPLRATHPRSSGSNFLSVPLPGNRLYLETVSETTQLRQHPTRDN